VSLFWRGEEVRRVRRMELVRVIKKTTLFSSPPHFGVRVTLTERVLIEFQGYGEGCFEVTEGVGRGLAKGDGHDRRSLENSHGQVVKVGRAEERHDHRSTMTSFLHSEQGASGQPFDGSCHPSFRPPDVSGKNMPPLHFNPLFL